MTNAPLKVWIGVALVAALAIENMWLWNKAKTSCFGGVVTGVIRSENAKAKDDVKQAETDTKAIQGILTERDKALAELERLRKERTTKDNRATIIQPSAKTASEASTCRSDSEYRTLTTDELRILQKASGAGKP